jgi:hypothetical protein
MFAFLAGKHASDQERPYFCTVCDLRFSTRKRWEKHMPKHSAEAPFVCKECGKAFKWKHALTAHSVVHASVKKFLCQECGFSTSHVSTFRFHNRLHSGNLMKCDVKKCTFQVICVLLFTFSAVGRALLFTLVMPGAASARAEMFYYCLKSSARLGSVRLGSARLSSAQLGSARLSSAQLGSARLSSARLSSAQLGSARLRLDICWLVPSLCARVLLFTFLDVGRVLLLFTFYTFFSYCRLPGSPTLSSIS